MYNHCKSTEDKDMTLIDFITDHLINIDRLFDKHDKGDSQKPHAPVNFHQTISASNYILYENRLITSPVKTVNCSYTDYYKNIVIADFTNSILRPPIF